MEGILFILVLCDVPILFPEAGSDDINFRAFIERGASWRVRASAAGLRRRVCVSSPSIGDEDPPATLTRSAWGRGIASSLNSQFDLTVRAHRSPRGITSRSRGPKPSCTSRASAAAGMAPWRMVA